MKTIHAYTEAGRHAPGFVSVNAHPDGTHSITVRNRKQAIAQLDMTPESMAVLALDILEYYNSLPAVTVRINGREHRLAGLGDSISYERLCHEAGVAVERCPTCTHSIPETRSGTITAGQRAPVAEGAIYNVMVTGGA